MDIYDKFIDVINNYNLSGEEVLNLLLDFNGSDIIDDRNGEFSDFLEEEGYNLW